MLQELDASGVALVLWSAWFYWWMYQWLEFLSAQELAKAHRQPPEPEHDAPAVAQRDLESVLREIYRRDGVETSEDFLAAARETYEAIIMAYLSGDRPVLQRRVSREVCDAFLEAITAREAASGRRNAAFLRLCKAEIVDGAMARNWMQVSLLFVGEFIELSPDVAEGGRRAVHHVTEDIWTFERGLWVGSGGWTLVATRGASVQS